MTSVTISPDVPSNTLASPPDTEQFKPTGPLQVDTEVFPNIIIFGESGTGKSSLINMFAGEELAAVSNKASGCTFESKPYVVSLEGRNYQLWDTCGLNEGDHGTSSAQAAIKALRDLIQNLQQFGGASLLVYCIRGSRFRDIWAVNHNLFVDIICQGEVPVVLAITGLENEEPDMEAWWKNNSNALETHHLKYEAHACLTTTLGKKSVIDGSFMYMDEYRESTDKLKRLIIDGCTKKPWKIPSESEWLRQVTLRINRCYEEHQTRTRSEMHVGGGSSATGRASLSQRAGSRRLKAFSFFEFIEKVVDGCSKLLQGGDTPEDNSTHPSRTIGAPNVPGSFSLIRNQE